MSASKSNRRTSSEIPALKKANKSIRYAQQMLLDPSLNHRYRAVSYLRLCCSAITSYRKQGIDLAPELDAQRPYLVLLQGFYQHDACWVSKCQVSAEGLLISSDAEINHSLQLVQRCIFQIHLESSPVEAAIRDLGRVSAAL